MFELLEPQGQLLQTELTIGLFIYCVFLPSHDWFPAIGIYVDSFVVWFVDYTRCRPASRGVGLADTSK